MPSSPDPHPDSPPAGRPDDRSAADLRTEVEERQRALADALIRLARALGGAWGEADIAELQQLLNRTADLASLRWRLETARRQRLRVALEREATAAGLGDPTTSHSLAVHHLAES